jgi:hypothetical protein
MPFIVCRSEGGPYDDVSFATGWQLGSIDAELATLAARRSHAPVLHTVRTPSVPQLDLIAMRHGFSLLSSDADEEWTTVVLVLPYEAGR